MKTNRATELSIKQLENEIKKVEAFVEYNKIIGGVPGGYEEVLAELKAKIREQKINLILN